MPLRHSLNQYSTQFRVDSTGDVPLDFGFPASRIRLVNRGGVPWRYSLMGSSGSTGAPELRAGETEILDLRTPASRLALISTSTTTSTAGDATLVEVNAWG